MVPNSVRERISAEITDKKINFNSDKSERLQSHSYYQSCLHDLNHYSKRLIRKIVVLFLIRPYNLNIRKFKHYDL